VSSSNPFSCKKQIFKVRVKVSYFYETLKTSTIFHGRTMAMAAMSMVSAGGFSGVSFRFRRCPQGVASYSAKNPFLGPQSPRSKSDHLTVCIGYIPQALNKTCPTAGNSTVQFTVVNREGKFKKRLDLQIRFHKLLRLNSLKGAAVVAMQYGKVSMRWKVRGFYGTNKLRS
jgi:hypothetical protein